MAGCVKTNFGKFSSPLSHRFHPVKPFAMDKLFLNPAKLPHFNTFSYTIF